MKLRAGDKVLIIAGKDRHKVGIIDRCLPKSNQVLIQGMNIAKKHLKRSAKQPQGGIIEIAKPLHASNVMLLDPSNDKPTRIGLGRTKDGRERVSKLTGQSIKDEEKKA